MEREVDIVERIDQEVLETAAHEEGHVVVAEVLRGTVHKRTVIPEGEAAGYATISFNGFHPQDRLIRFMATLCGGLVAEEKIGKTDHRGTGSDMAKLDHLSQVVSDYFYGGRVAAEHFKQRAFSLARAALSGISYSHLQQRALRLYHAGTII